MAAKNRAPRERVIEVLILAADLGAVCRAAHQLKAADNVARDALYYAETHTRELMVAGEYTTYNEALRSAALSLSNGIDALRAEVQTLELTARAKTFAIDGES